MSNFFKEDRPHLMLGITGFSLGILTGLSASPVVGIVITATIGVAVAVTGALAGVEKAEERGSDRSIQVKTTPLAVLATLLMLGSIAGLLLRTHDVFGGTSSQVSAWKETELSEKEIALRIFNAEYPINNVTKASELNRISQTEPKHEKREQRSTEEQGPVVESPAKVVSKKKPSPNKRTNYTQSEDPAIGQLKGDLLEPKAGPLIKNQCEEIGGLKGPSLKRSLKFLSRKSALTLIGENCEPGTCIKEVQKLCRKYW